VYNYILYVYGYMYMYMCFFNKLLGLKSVTLPPFLYLYCICLITLEVVSILVYLRILKQRNLHIIKEEFVIL